MPEQWQTTLANDVRFIRTRLEGQSWYWNLIQTMLLLWIGLGVWTGA